jgi:hypothetical protein
MITNFFTPLEFLVTINRLPNVEFYTQRAVIPGISANPVSYPTRFNKMYETPDELTYNNFEFSFIIDENMNNFLEVFNWMVGLTAPTNGGQFKKLKESKDGLISDISIIVLNSNKNSSIKVIFKNCFPISLSEIILDTTQRDVEYPQATVSFQYDYYEIEKITN